jgi:B12-binding domain/radical SAM domain protein
MTTPTLILLHAPSVYDFREHVTLRGPVSDLVPSSSVFEMYPIGFASIAAYLEDRGYKVRIVNLAAHMLKTPHFNVERFIARLESPLVFGIDLHWLPHAHGALEVARIVKAHHPDVPVLFGGFSSTYFHEELITNPLVDYVIRGDSTEQAVQMLIDALANGHPVDDVPNLTWRDTDGAVRVNPLAYSPPNLEAVDMDFRRLMLSAVRDRDLTSYLPFAGWLQYPIMPAMSCRGCVLKCVGCGGSAFAFNKLHGRDRPVFREPEKLAEDMHHIASISNSPIFILGDIRQAGRAYAETFLDAVQGIKTPVILELFFPSTAEFMQRVASAMPSFAVEMSIESHDPVVRRAFGKSYDNDVAETTFAHVLEAGASRLDVFFMTGLPYQTYDSVLGTADYVESLLMRFGAERRFRPFIGPMAPFVDPGSLAFEQPEEHGYTIHYRTLAEHREALLAPSWQYTLNYETRWMTRREIVLSTYDVCLRFCELKAQFGLIDPDAAERVRQTLQLGRDLAVQIDDLYQRGDMDAIAALRPQIEQVNAAQGVGEDRELRLAMSRQSFRWLQITGYALQTWASDVLRGRPV